MQPGKAPYSYREDSRVPGFPDDGPVCVMDAACGLCARGAAWIARNDRAHDFRIVPLQSDLGRALMAHYDLDPDDPRSWLMLEEGQAYVASEAILRTAARLGGLWRALPLLRVIPRRVRDAAYGLVARHRRRVMGTASFCDLPDRAVQSRILT